jgi:hypothetical protein
MLINEMYIGNMVQHRQENISYKSKKKKHFPKSQWTIVEGTHEPIIDIELWNRTQKLVSQRSRQFGDTGKIGLFARKVKCMDCGYILKSSITRHERYLKCATRELKKDLCQGACIKYDKLEQYVLEELKKFISLYMNEKELYNQVEVQNLGKLDLKIAESKKNIEVFNKKINVCTIAVKNLYTDKIKNIITDDEFYVLAEEYRQDKEKITYEMQEEQSHLDKLIEKTHTSDNIGSIIEKYINIEKLEREHVEELIDCIYVGKTYPGTRKRPIIIEWNF